MVTRMVVSGPELINSGDHSGGRPGYKKVAISGQDSCLLTFLLRGGVLVALGEVIQIIFVMSRPSKNHVFQNGLFGHQIWVSRVGFGPEGSY